MILESIIFNVTAFVLFILIFFKIIKKNDTNYIYILLIQGLGILISFLSLLLGIKIQILIKVMIYIFSIIIPLSIILMEKKWVDFSEMLYIVKASVLIYQNKKEEVKHTYLKMIELRPNSYYGHKFLAKYYEKIDDKISSLEEYYRALKIKMDDYDTFYKIARLNKELGYNERAEQVLREILQSKPEHKDSTLLLGQILYESEKYKEAINIYMEALKYNALEYDIYYNLGMVYTKINDFGKAKSFYEQAAELNSCFYNVKYDLALISLISNDFIEAEKYFMEALNGIDVEAKAYYYLARIAMLGGYEEKAINYINMAIELDSEIFEMVKDNSIFIKIQNSIIRKISEVKECNSSFIEKETYKHLETTYELVGKLKYKKDCSINIEEKNQFIEKEKYIREIMEKE